MPEKKSTHKANLGGEPRGHAKVSLPGTLPGAVRINRRTALLAIGAVVLFLVVIVSQGVLGSGGEDASGQSGESEAPPAASGEAPAYASADLPEAATDTSQRWRPAEGAVDAESAAAQRQARRAQAEARRRRGRTPPPGTAVPGAGSPQQDKPSAREKAYQSALASPLAAVARGNNVGSRRPGASSGQTSPGGPSSGDAGSRPASLSPQEVQQQTMNQFQGMFDQLRGAGPGGQSGSAPAQPEPGRSGFQERALQQASRGTYIAATVDRPISPYEVKAGTVVSAVLQTSISSDLPGEIRAQVLRPVYDRTQSYVLIPAGTQLLGSYSSAVATGQSRALVAWTRMIFPDGGSVSLPGLGGKDLAGASGLEGDVDNHYGRVFGTAALLAAVGGGLELATPDDNAGGFSVQRSPQEVMSAQVATELSRVATEMLRQQINVKPTIEVEKGYRFYVYFNRDLAFEAPYQGELSRARFRAPSRTGRADPIRRVEARRLPADTSNAAAGARAASPLLVPTDHER